MTIWITGATGFVGRALIKRLQADGQTIAPISRTATTVLGVPAHRIAALGSLLAPGDTVVYCAGRAHVGHPCGANPDQPRKRHHMGALRMGVRRGVPDASQDNSGPAQKRHHMGALRMGVRRGVPDASQDNIGPAQKRHHMGALRVGVRRGVPDASQDNNGPVGHACRAYRRANCDEPLAAARLASARGAKRFVFVSSIKVNGEKTEGTPFSETDAPAPQDDYGLSKWEGEQALWEHARLTGMELVIVRPPLVYGPGVRANMAALMRTVERGWPLPLASVRNKRSLVFVENLVDFLALCCTHPAAANETFLLSDGRDLSTAELVRLMAHAQGRAARLWPCPPWLLTLGAGLLRRRSMADRLCESLQVNDSLARKTLGWQPPFSVEEGLRRMVVEGKP